MARNDAARQKIVDAYAKAKRTDPKLTQATFMRRALEESGQKVPKDPGRYLRKIVSGERTGGKMYGKAQAGPEKGLYQAAWSTPDKATWFSMNLSVGHAESTFDIPAIEATLRQKHLARMERMVRAKQKDYGLEADEIDATDFHVRLIRKQKADPFRVVIK
jgi:hypothetical protein